MLADQRDLDAGAADLSPGTGDAVCGALNDPCVTIQHAIDSVFAQGKRDVYVGGGTYENAAFFMTDGVNVFGGFGSNFQRDPILALTH